MVRQGLTCVVKKELIERLLRERVEADPVASAGNPNAVQQIPADPVLGEEE